MKPTAQQLDVFLDLLVDVVLREMRGPQEFQIPEKQKPALAYDGSVQALAEARHAQHTENASE